MTQVDDLDPRFMELASRFLDGAGSADELEALSAILRADPRAADVLSELLNQHGTLALSLRGAASYRETKGALEGAGPTEEERPRASRRAWWMAVPVAACLAVIATVALYQTRPPDPGGKPAATPVTLSFQDGVQPSPDYLGTRGTKIVERRPALAFGYEATLEVEGGAGEGESDALLSWDLSRIPRGSRILSAEITLEVSKAREREAVYQLWELRRGWFETEATWTTAAAGNFWEAPGAKGPSDKGPAPLAEFQARKGTLTIQLGPSALRVIERWVRSPGENHGILVMHPRESGEFYFASRRAEQASSRPRLTITFGPAER